jgi:hypothetical protein
MILVDMVVIHLAILLYQLERHYMFVLVVNEVQQLAFLVREDLIEEVLVVIIVIIVIIILVDDDELVI